MRPLAQFDGFALFAALDCQREQRGLGWSGVARQIEALSFELTARKPGHPISPATLTGIATRGDTSCQHALVMLRWLDRSPESFLAGTLTVTGSLPAAGPDRRLRWHLHASSRRRAPGLYEVMDDRRRNEELTWAQLARRLEASPAQLSGLRRARYGGMWMSRAMRITQWLERPAADFIYAADW